MSDDTELQERTETREVKPNYANPPTIGEILQTVSEGEDLDTAAILAGVVNLQLGALMRKQSRSHFGPQDAQIMVRIARMLLSPPASPYSQYAPKRSS